MESQAQQDRRDKFNARVTEKDSRSRYPAKKGNFKVGDIIFLKDDLNKSRGREEYMVLEKLEQDGQKWLKIRKTQKQFRKKTYLVKENEVILAPFAKFDDFFDNDDDESDDETSQSHEQNFLSRREKVKEAIDSFDVSNEINSRLFADSSH